MPLVKIKTASSSLVLDSVNTILTSDQASGVSSLTVKNITNFAVNQILLIGVLGNQGAEIIKTHASSAPSGSTITLASATLFPHSSSTPVTVIPYDQIEFSTAYTPTGSKSVLATNNIAADSPFSTYNDTAGNTGYYFARFKNSIDASFSSYSDPIPTTGITILTARSLIDNALGELNKTTSDVLTDEYAFNQINNCQQEVLREQKRWSFMQSFNYNLGQLTTGTWRVALPADCDDQNTNKSIYNLRIGTIPDLKWIDKAKWDEMTSSVAWTTLASIFNIGDSTVTLTSSSDFADSGTIYIGANTYSYTANNRTAGVLTLSAVSTTGAASGSSVFFGASFGMPQVWTTFGGYAYFYPVLGSTFNQRNAYMDYYKSLTSVMGDGDTTVLPDPTVVQYYLQWKFLKKLNNGKETPESQACRDLYVNRRDQLVRKDSINRTFRWKPTVNSINESSLQDTSTRRERLGNFPNI